MNKYSIFACLFFALNAGGGPSKMLKEGYENPPACVEPNYRDYAREINNLCWELGGVDKIPDEKVREVATLLRGIDTERRYSFVNDAYFADAAGRGVVAHLSNIICYGHHLPVSVMKQLLSELRAYPHAHGFIAISECGEFEIRRAINLFETKCALGMCDAMRTSVAQSESLQLFEAELRRTKLALDEEERQRIDAVAAKTALKTALVAARLGFAQEK